MDNSNVSKNYNKSTKENFVIMYNNVNFSKEQQVEYYQVGFENRKRTQEIVEYTDDVAEQVRDLYQKITNNLEDYFQGKNQIIDVNNRIRQFYKNIKNYCITTGLINEDNVAYKSKIIKDIYRSYRYNAVIAAVNVNDNEGRQFALKNSEKDNDCSHYFIYYNSDYFFACENLREKLTDMVNKLAMEEKIEDFDTHTIDKRKRYVYDYGFNYAWSWSNKMNIDSAVNINNNLVPPEKIKVFYKEYLESQRNGKLLISYKENNIEVDLQSKDRRKNENCNLHDILKSKNIDINKNCHLNEFLNSFFISTKDH